MGWFPRARRDANHKSAVDALILERFSVADLSAAGGGCADLLVGDDDGHGVGEWDQLIEMKVPSTLKGGGGNKKVRERQEKFRRTWKGRPVQVFDDVPTMIAWCLEERRKRRARRVFKTPEAAAAWLRTRGHGDTATKAVGPEPEADRARRTDAANADSVAWKDFWKDLKADPLSAGKGSR
jgi:hypothetical protein